MKVVEILKIGRNILETLQKSCISISDVQYLDMYDEYKSFMEQNHKITYIAAMLSEKYKISERQFYYVIKRFETICNIPATE